MEKQHTPDWINNAAEDIYVHAANDHDRMREALERIAEGEWDERLHGNGIANEFMQIAAAALQTSDAQQEPRNGTV